MKNSDCCCSQRRRKRKKETVRCSFCFLFNAVTHSRQHTAHIQTTQFENDFNTMKDVSVFECYRLCDYYVIQNDIWASFLYKSYEYNKNAPKIMRNDIKSQFSCDNYYYMWA